MPEKDIGKLKKEIEQLRKELKAKEALLQNLLQHEHEQTNMSSEGLTTNEVIRYSRQMIMPQVGLRGQIALKNSKVLVVGAGGLGCPASLYLVSAGIGEITIVDYDEVETSNLHRQVLHSEINIGIPKVESAYHTLKSVNSNTKITALNLHLESNSVKQLLADKRFDVVIDGSDNVATRYLLNDMCVMNDMPLVSGSALQGEGQLTVYHHKDGPCYRCLFPIPPPASTVTSCGDGGVLGPVPGTIGVLQALEAIKIIIKSSGVMSGRLLLFDGMNTTFRNIKLRNKNPNCDVCGNNPTITDLVDYEQFCGAGAHDKVVNIEILKPEEHIDVEAFSKLIGTRLIIDVRPQLEHEMCRLPNTVNFPYSSIKKDRGLEDLKQLLEGKAEKENVADVYVICRRGNDSQRSISLLKKKFNNIPVNYFNVRGGLHAYSKLVDPHFPAY